MAVLKEVDQVFERGWYSTHLLAARHDLEGSSDVVRIGRTAWWIHVVEDDALRFLDAETRPFDVVRGNRSGVRKPGSSRSVVTS